MPEISRFFGIVIKMFYWDHAPPHFHAVYGEHEILVYLDSGAVEGQFPTRALSLVLEWYRLHSAELHEDWRLASERKPLKAIQPLE
jgi:hypothetical protein